MATQKMNLDLVEEMVTNYKSKQYLSIVTNTINPMPFDAQSVWFDLESLKGFVTAIEEETAKHPEYGLKNFGVRFYYSAYPKSESWENPEFGDLATSVDDKYAKLHTLVGIPTAEMSGVNSDFNPCDTNTYTGNKPSGTGVVIMAENHGILCPPESPTGLWF